MEAGLRALGYCSGGCAVSLGGFAAVRAIRIRRQRRAAAFCSREWQEIASPPGSRSGVPVPLTSPALANVSAVAVGGDGNGAAGGPVGSGVEVARARRMLQVVLVSPLVSGDRCLLNLRFQLSFLWPTAILLVRYK
jgi:tRNA (cytidine/uridine-2'-O-)-methyltransferase